MAKRRASGEGSVNKRADGRWEGRIIIGRKENGRPIYKSVLAKTQKELMPKLRKLREDYEGIELTPEKDLTLAVWMERWLREYTEKLNQTVPGIFALKNFTAITSSDPLRCCWSSGLIQIMKTNMKAS